MDKKMLESIGFAEKPAGLPTLTFENIKSMLRPEFSDYAPLLLDAVVSAELERAVISAAETWYSDPKGQSDHELGDAVRALLKARNQ